MLPNWYSEYKQLIESSINTYFKNYFKNNITNPWLQNFKDIVFYSVKWWKKVRSILALEFFLTFTWKKIEEISKEDDIVKFCIAIEILHAYSLIHDDLPSMDNDDYRRWELTVWKKFSEYEAVLIWDFFNSLSFQILSEIWNTSLIKYFWEAVWFNWMIGGQVDDMYFEKNFWELNLEHLIKLHNKKTWALIKISILGWLILANKTFNKDNKLKKEDIIKYWSFWEKIGLAFQIKDDLLDIEWTFEETGKSVWGEEKWFIFFMWVDKSKQYLQNLLDECLDIIKTLNSEKLVFLVNYIWNRNK